MENNTFVLYDPKLAEKVTESAKNETEKNAMVFISLLYNVDVLVIEKYKEIYGKYPGIPFSNTDIEMDNIKRRLLIISRILKINKIRKCT